MRSFATFVVFPAVFAAIVAALPSRAAQDWPQFFGPERNGVYSGPPIDDSWDGAGPEVLWRLPVGQGFSGPVVAGGRLVLHHRLGDQEVVEAFDAATGESLWRHAYPTTYRDDFGFDEGPRAVPVIVDGRVFTYGAQGALHAIDLENGEPLWDVDAMARFDVPKGYFGAGGSPLVENGRVIANVGGQDPNPSGIVAFDAGTGEVLWTATDHEASYSSPVGATFDGRRWGVFFTRNGLVGIDPANGSVGFDLRWRSRSDTSVNAASPVVVGDRIFISAEYGPGAGVLEWTGDGIVEIWSSNDALSNHYATSVHRDGILYGYHGRQEFGPSLRAVEFDTGRVRWSLDQFRAGSIMLVGDRVLVIREAGELILAEATPEEFVLVARARVLDGTVRAYPALADGILYLRNEDTLVALDLRLGSDP
jgi:outer membrane protein assembly factor BamB